MFILCQLFLCKEVKLDEQININCFDIGIYGNRLRPLYRHYFEKAQALIFVVNSDDRDIIVESQDELLTIINDKNGLLNKDQPLLVLANKQDLPNAMTDKITNLLGLRNLNRNWKIQGTSEIERRGFGERFS